MPWGYETSKRTVIETRKEGCEQGCPCCDDNDWDREQAQYENPARLEVLQGVKSVDTVDDMIAIVRHAMEALQFYPRSPADDKQLVFNELSTILDFLGAAYE